MRAALLGAFLLAAGVPARAYDTVRFLAPVSAPALERPAAAVEAGGRLYAADSRRRALLVFDASGRLLKNVSGVGLREPRGLAVGPDGRVYVADAGADRIQIFDRDGGVAAGFGSRGSEPGHLRDPESVAVGEDGRVYVADTGNDRVQVFTPEGVLLFGFGQKGKGPGEFRSPSRVSVDPADEICVVDRGNDRVQKFDAKARFLREYPLLGRDAACDEYGFLYMLDGEEGRVTEVAPDGAVLGRFGSYGSDEGQFKKAAGLSAAGGGELVVADSGNGRIQRAVLVNKLKTSPLPPDPDAKLSVRGPDRSIPLAASALAPSGADLLAYLPEPGVFVRLGPDGREKARFGAKGKGPAQTRGVGGLAASAKLGIFASDEPDDRLQDFDADGKWVKDIAAPRGFFDSKHKEGRLDDPAGVAVNDAGTVYVADAGNRRVQAFGPDGVFLFAIGPALGAYELKDPRAVNWDPSGYLYIADKGLKRIFKCEPSGALVASWGEEGEGPGRFLAPAALAGDERGDVYVLDSRLRRVSVFDKDGRWLTDFLSGGKGDRELRGPTDLVVQDGRLLVADPEAGRVVSYDLRFQPAPPPSVSTAAKEGAVSLSWTAAPDPWVDGYAVLRSSAPGGPFREVGRTKLGAFSDADVSAEGRYWYRVAATAGDKGEGVPGPAAAVFVPASVNLAPVVISSVTLSNLYAAQYKRYLTHPVGRAVVTNNVNEPFHDVLLRFKLKDYMDFGFDTVIKTLGPGKSAEIPLIATLNNKVLEVTEDTPVQAEFALSYFQDGQPRSASLTKPLRLYSRNAISWDDPRKLASFITYKDEPVKAFNAGVAAAFKDRAPSPLNPAVDAALRLWSALGEYGLRFMPNPANPFEHAHDDPSFPVDYTQYPRETLQRRGGQCSDLVSLYASLLINDEVRVAVLDYPGHMALMLDTEAQDPVEAGLPPDLLVEHEGTLWLPVETTLVGGSFLEAVSKAAYACRAESARGRARIYDVDAAFGAYEPVTMPPTDFNPAPGDPAALSRLYGGQAAVLAKQSRGFLAGHYEDRLKANPRDADAGLQLGIAAYRFGDYAGAAARFKQVLALDAKDADALNDLGGAQFMSGDYAGAEASFLQASASAPSDPDIWLNLAKTEAKLKKAAQAREYGAKAVALSADYKPYVDVLTSGLQ